MLHVPIREPTVLRPFRAALFFNSSRCFVLVAGTDLRLRVDRRVETPRFTSCPAAGAQARQLPVSPARYACTPMARLPDKFSNPRFAHQPAHSPAQNTLHFFQSMSHRTAWRMNHAVITKDHQNGKCGAIQTAAIKAAKSALCTFSLRRGYRDEPGPTGRPRSPASLHS